MTSGNRIINRTSGCYKDSTETVQTESFLFVFLIHLVMKRAEGYCVGRTPVWVATMVWGQGQGFYPCCTPRRRLGQVSLPLCGMMSAGEVSYCWPLGPLCRFRFYVSRTFLIFLPPSSVPEGRGWGKRTTGNSSICFVFSVMNFTLKNKIASSWGEKPAGFIGRFYYREQKLKCEKFPGNRESIPEAENNTMPPWEEQPPESQCVTCRNVLEQVGETSDWRPWGSLQVPLRLNEGLWAGWGDTKTSALHLLPEWADAFNHKALSFTMGPSWT